MSPLARAARALVLLVTSSCTSISIEVEAISAPQPPQGPLRTVVLAPLVNHTPNPQAGAAMRGHLQRALEAEAGIVVLDAPPAAELDPARLDREQAAEVARLARADALLSATLFEFGYNHDPDSRTRETLPVVRVAARLVEAATGRVLWEARVDGAASASVTKISATLTSVADEAAVELARDLVARLGVPAP